MKDFAKIAQPVTRLLQDDVPWEFDEECQQAFYMLKEKLVSSPILKQHIWDMSFEVECYADNNAVGAILR